ncbi:Hypothetical protein PP7435_CHR1-0495 [Komagataella phaffii CBS 7435]|uniref:Uncharacterized protein n=2 Tax=Komagataella phaffii TaxID=460519 RepID=C4QWC8_KOMPG|nr:Hypothetical protein PAS_chr1-1_0185 [Komagataella phaffii GS115]CAH2446221.1 Hypothetical protein BQ9382_C1-2575 [Komagataella phaffii CBS 7435]CAY67551.1 Hypothetical protein PAS_chr1-1_0185 [Komagataella phaffii GS115]CCA36647.1 Hypothetical protein PP7435_CHR1-0495 [Komagataella phaffii CBS 7435]
MTMPKAISDAQSLQTTHYTDAESNFSNNSRNIQDRDDSSSGTNSADRTQEVSTINSQPTVTDAPIYSPSNKTADRSKTDNMSDTSSSSSDEPQRTRSQIIRDYRYQQRQGFKGYNEQNIAENSKSCLVQYIPCLGNLSCECIGSLCVNSFCNFGQVVKSATTIR